MSFKYKYFSFAVAGFLIFAVFYKHMAICSNKKSSEYDLSKLSEYSDVYPVVVCGSGPAGWSAAIYTSRAGYPTLVLKGDLPGGQLTKTSYIENWPGQEKVLGATLMEELERQATSFGVKSEFEIVDSVNFNSWPFQINTSSGKVYYAMSVVVATGSSPKKLGIPGEEEYWGKGVTTCAICDAPFYKGKKVIVVGGGDSAAEEAMQLALHAREVEIFVRSDKMRASKIMIDTIKKIPNIKITYNVKPKEILGTGQHVNGIYYTNKENNTEHMSIDGVFLAIGHTPNTQIFKDFIEMDSMGYIKLNGRSQQTSKHGVFAAGDVEDYVYKQAGVASGSGIKAALDAENFLKEIGVTPGVINQIEMNKSSKQPIQPKVEYVGSITEAKSIKDVESAIANNKNVIIDFYSQVCPPCKKMLPVFSEIAGSMSNVKFIKVDIANLSTSDLEKLEITVVPCFMIYKAGKFIEKKYGATPKDQFESWIQKGLSL